MRYLYGDGSEFPLRENFIQTLCAATDACVALLEVDEAQIRVRRALEAENACAISELAELGALRGAVERALSQADRQRASVHRVAVELRELAYAHVERARAEVKHRREEIHRKATTAQSSGRVLTALERFLASHQLPNTTWALSWWAGVGDQTAEARAYALMPRGMAATMHVQIPATHLWARPVRVSRLEKNVVVRMQRKNLLGKVGMGDVRLDRYYITRVVHTPMREALVLSKHENKPSPGIMITLREQQDEQVRAVPVDANGNPTGEPAVLVGSFKVMVQGLWVHVQRTIRDLILHRRHVEMATLNGRPVVEIERPVGLVRAIISALAPWVRNVRRRSHITGTLALKQERGDGGTQEAYVTHYDLIRRFRHLSPQHRSMFDAFGLTSIPAGSARPRAREAAEAAARDLRARQSVRAVNTAETRPEGEMLRAAVARQRHRAEAEAREAELGHGAAASFQPRDSTVRPAARPSTAASQPAQPPRFELPTPSTPPRPRPVSVPASYQLPPTIPPPPDAYTPRRLPPTIPPPIPEAYALVTPPPVPRAYAVGAPPPTIPPPAPRPELATQPTRPALRVINGG